MDESGIVILITGHPCLISGPLLELSICLPKQSARVGNPLGKVLRELNLGLF